VTSAATALSDLFKFIIPYPPRALGVNIYTQYKTKFLTWEDSKKTIQRQNDPHFWQFVMLLSAGYGSIGAIAWHPVGCNPSVAPSIRTKIAVKSYFPASVALNQHLRLKGSPS
jgi:hypothetical protein